MDPSIPPGGMRSKVGDDVAEHVGSYRMKAVQLAGNAKLPAAFMSMAGTHADVRTPPAIQAALQSIADKFYQDLAEAAGQQQEDVPSVASEPPAGPTRAPDEDGTVVIAPGAALDAASGHANELYRALFGDSALNQHSMDSANEVLLPDGAGN